MFAGGIAPLGETLSYQTRVDDTMSVDRRLNHCKSIGKNEEERDTLNISIEAQAVFVMSENENVESSYNVNAPWKLLPIPTLRTCGLLRPPM